MLHGNGQKVGKATCSVLVGEMIQVRQTNVRGVKSVMFYKFRHIYESLPFSPKIS